MKASCSSQWASFKCKDHVLTLPRLACLASLYSLPQALHAFMKPQTCHQTRFVTKELEVLTIFRIESQGKSSADTYQFTSEPCPQHLKQAALHLLLARILHLHDVSWGRCPTHSQHSQEAVDRFLIAKHPAAYHRPLPQVSNGDPPWEPEPIDPPTAPAAYSCSVPRRPVACCHLCSPCGNKTSHALMLESGISVSLMGKSSHTISGSD